MKRYSVSDLSDRRNVMHSLIKSNDVQEAIRRESIRGKISMLDAERRAIGYVNEIVSDYSHFNHPFCGNGAGTFMDAAL